MKERFNSWLLLVACDIHRFLAAKQKDFLLFRDLKKDKKTNFICGSKSVYGQLDFMANEDRALCSYGAFWTSTAFFNSPVLENKGLKKKIQIFVAFPFL